MRDLMLALIAGIAVGMLFRLIKLPLPAPPVLSGVIGIFGVYFGGVIFDYIQTLIH